VIGPMIRELTVPRDATFVAVLREDHVVVPRGDTVFQAGDEVIALVTPDSEDEIRRMLTGK
jgi:trk system potassium uptake protein TrkA